MTHPDSTTPGGPGFQPTRWSRVLRSHGREPEARVALSELCEAYWEPVFRTLRHEGRCEDEARELAQAFFARVLAGTGFGGADPTKGRFRSYLLGALRHFLADRRDAERRAKRGGGVVPEPLDSLGELEPADPASSRLDLAFDRAWALAVMGRAMERLESDSGAGDRLAVFRALRPWLAGIPTAEEQASVRAALGLNENALKVAVHRLRRRFRDAIRDEIAQTLPPDGVVEEELRHLVDVLGNS